MIKTQEEKFNENKVLEELRHYLPAQTPLKDFIHHNSLHAFQHLKFYEGIFKAAKIFGYQVTLQLNEYRQLHAINRVRQDVLERIISDKKGADKLNEWLDKLLNKQYDEVNEPRVGRFRSNWKAIYKIDLDALVHPLLFRILGGYLDQGISIWNFPAGNDGILTALRELEQNSYTSFFKTKRAKQLLLQENCSIEKLLDIVVGNEAYYEQYLFDQQFAHRGWSGMVATLENVPESLYDRRSITLHDFIILDLLLEIDALDCTLGSSWAPLCNRVTEAPLQLFDDVKHTEIIEVLKLWQDAFEWSYYDGVIAGIVQSKKKITEIDGKKSFQALFCIDERECSLRRYIELMDPESETFGSPGFFGVEFYFQPEGAKFYDKLCPAPVTPRYLIKESGVQKVREHELLYTPKIHHLFAGFGLSMLLGAYALARLFLNVFKPKMSPAISNAFGHMDRKSTLTIENKKTTDVENGLQIGFSIEEMTVRVENLLTSIGLTKSFASIVYFVAHGSSSANNPHHGAHDCGACSGRPGSVNARVIAFMANHAGVRHQLRLRGIVIPETTQFIGGLHDTAGDEIEYYDEDILTDENVIIHKRNIHVFERALDANAKERSRRFASIDTTESTKKVRKAIKERSVSMFEPRPELGHGTNALCIVGGRDLTRGLFLDRRAFLNSYDYKSDPEGVILSKIMRPLGPVCGGINLEYYFSRVDNHKLGAGTKLPHNVMGLIGVANGCDGDLLPGLPLQMIEVHDPVRLLLIVEHNPDVILKTIKAVPEMYEWYINDWIHLLAVDPQTQLIYYFIDGAFKEYKPLLKLVSGVGNIHELIDSAKLMETNKTVHATTENLPVYTLN